MNKEEHQKKLNEDRIEQLRTFWSVRCFKLEDQLATTLAELDELRARMERIREARRQWLDTPDEPGKKGLPSDVTYINAIGKIIDDQEATDAAKRS